MSKIQMRGLHKIVIANEVKQSHGIATLSPRAGLLAMTALFDHHRHCSPSARSPALRGEGGNFDI